MQHSNSLTSLHCPTCNGPLTKDVLEKPIQCIYCDVWVATNDGRQQKVILSHAQITDLGKGIQPSEPIFKEGSPLDRLFGRIRRIVPMIIGIPLVWVLMMHLFVGRQWIGPHALPMGDMDVVGLYTFIVWVFTAVTGYGILSALMAFSMSLSVLSSLLLHLESVEDISAFMSSESGIVALFRIGVPLFAAVIWAMMQDAQGFQRSLKKIWVARFRFGTFIALGCILSWTYFDRPTTRMYLESKQEEFAQQTQVFARLCAIDSSSETPTTEPIVPPPRLEFTFLKGSNGNIETILCSRALSNEWVSKYVREDQGDHPDLNIQTQLGHLLDLIHRSHMRDAFLTPKYEQMVESALSPAYWLLYDASCADESSLVGKVYDPNSQQLLRKVTVPCSGDSITDRKAFFEALTIETGGVFVLDY
jgi:hypothetical protein